MEKKRTCTVSVVESWLLITERSLQYVNQQSLSALHSLRQPFHFSSDCAFSLAARTHFSATSYHCHTSGLIVELTVLCVVCLCPSIALMWRQCRPLLTTLAFKTLCQSSMELVMNQADRPRRTPRILLLPPQCQGSKCAPLHSYFAYQGSEQRPLCLYTGPSLIETSPLPRLLNFVISCLMELNGPTFIFIEL